MIYDRDFENSGLSLDASEAVLTELMQKFTYTHIYKGNANLYKWPSFNNNVVWTDTEIKNYKGLGYDLPAGYVMEAYIMINYEDLTVNVFFDSWNTIQAVDTITKTVTGNGFSGEAVLAYNKLTDITDVTVTLDKKVKDVTVTAPANADAVTTAGNTVTFSVSGEYTGDVAITATVEGVVEVLTKVENLAFEKLVGMYEDRDTEVILGVDALYDGIYSTGTHWSNGAARIKIKNFSVKYDDQLAEGDTSNKYWGAIVTKLSEAQDLKAFRAVYAACGDQFLPQGFDVLVSKDGETWTLAASTSSTLVGDGAWMVIAGENGNNASNVCEVSLENAEDVLYVAYAVHTHSTAAGSWRDINNMYELELYK